MDIRGKDNAILGGKGLIGKVDLVLWANNGAATLPMVLRRVDEGIPSEAVDKKIFVDEPSVVAEDFGWAVYLNEKGGGGSGANLALRHVTNEYFISLEQDVVLAKDWFEKIPKSLERKDVVVARFSVA